MTDTKERILQTALRLFAADGYEAVSVSMIAGELGMTKGALYKHYENKRAIFDAILHRMEARDAQSAAENDLPQDTLQNAPESYRNIGADSIMSFARTQFIYWTEDNFASLFRKMLTLEQFRSEEMSRLYRQYLVAGPVGYMTDLFSCMGCADARQKAVSFYAPMFLLYSLYDGAADKAEVLRLADDCFEKLGQRLAKEASR